MAGEIAKTQQREAGTMLGWLQQWNQPDRRRQGTRRQISATARWQIVGLVQ